jgi:molybdopterin-guanine dinucleotide biosynthesis protein A
VVSGAPVVVAVLAGGAGRRIEGGKAAVKLHGQPLIDYPLRAARDAGLEAVVLAKRDSVLPETRAAVLYEPDLPLHPLCGVVTALGRWPAVLAVGCDMPFLTAPLLVRLAAADAGAAVARHDGALQPLPALYRRTHLRRLIEAVQSGEPMRRTLAALGPQVLSDASVAECGDPRRLFYSVNDRDSLARAAAWLEGRDDADQA